MVPPGPEAWKRLRAPRKIYANIYPILVLLHSLLRYVVYVQKATIFAQRRLNALYVERGLQHLNIFLQQSFTALSITVTNKCQNK